MAHCTSNNMTMPERVEKHKSELEKLQLKKKELEGSLKHVEKESEAENKIMTDLKDVNVKIVDTGHELAHYMWQVRRAAACASIRPKPSPY